MWCICWSGEHHCGCGQLKLQIEAKNMENPCILGKDSKNHYRPTDSILNKTDRFAIDMIELSKDCIYVCGAKNFKSIICF